MPTYDYLCAANGTRASVRHSFADGLRTWRELCARASLPLGATDPDAAVERIITGGLDVITDRRQGPASNNSPGCRPQGCGHCLPPS